MSKSNTAGKTTNEARDAALIERAASGTSFPTLAEFAATLKTKEEREQAVKELTYLADEIWKLVQAKHAHGGTLPPGTLPRAAHQLERSEDQISRLIERMELHQRARLDGQQVGPRIRAVIPRRKGRKKGKHDLPDPVTEFIIDAWKSQKWESSNHQGNKDEFNQPLNRAMVHRMTATKFTNLKISRTTVWRVINEYEQREGARSSYARGNKDEVRDNLLAMKGDFGGPNNVWIADIRPLPIRSQYKTLQ